MIEGSYQGFALYVGQNYQPNARGIGLKELQFSSLHGNYIKSSTDDEWSHCPRAVLLAWLNSDDLQQLINEKKFTFLKFHLIMIWSDGLCFFISNILSLFL